MIARESHRSSGEGYVIFSENTYVAWSMAVLSLKTELDVAELLLAEGWFPEEINGILVFPLPRAAFHQLSGRSNQLASSNVINATPATPTTLYRARQLLTSAGWLDRELESLLKPYLYSTDPWANQSIHTQPRHTTADHCQAEAHLSLEHYRCAMALKRVASLAAVVTIVCAAVVMFG